VELKNKKEVEGFGEGKKVNAGRLKLGGTGRPKSKCFFGANGGLKRGKSFQLERSLKVGHTGVDGLLGRRDQIKVSTEKTDQNRVVKNGKPHSPDETPGEECKKG